MRRFIALALLVGAVLVLPTMAGAGDADVKGPPCADVVFGSGSTGGLVADLAAAPCPFVSYTLDVYSDPTETTLLRTVTPDPLFVGDPTSIGFLVGGDTDGLVCVRLTTSVGGGKHVFDSAPDADAPCAEVATIFSPGFGGFN